MGNRIPKSALPKAERQQQPPTLDPTPPSSPLKTQPVFFGFGATPSKRYSKTPDKVDEMTKPSWKMNDLLWNKKLCISYLCIEM